MNIPTNSKKYFLGTFLCAVVVPPLLLSLALLSAWYTFLLVLHFLILGVGYIRHVKKKDLPGKAWIRYSPYIAAFAYYMTIWIVAMITAGHSYSEGLFDSIAFYFLTWPYFLIIFALDFIGGLFLFPYIQVVLYGYVLLMMSIAGRIYGKKPVRSKGLVIITTSFFAICFIAGCQFIGRKNTFLSNDTRVERIEEEVRTHLYKPFSEGNILTPLEEKATLSIDSDYPRIDGAIAAIPVYGAMVEMVYKGLDSRKASDYVQCRNTTEAYEGLIAGKSDVIFCAHPSQKQLLLAKKNGKELKLTPIAREAFVFFVNSENPVTNLTTEQIRNIYQKKITNWKELGGKHSRIMPFQRPANSGSQSAMLSLVMKGAPLPHPLREEYAGGMGGMIRRIAAYRNYSSAIGYSFRYYATRMNPHAGIRLISIDGVEPIPANIRNGTYPFTGCLYAVTTGNETENTKQLIEWLLSSQGQRLVEYCGYIRLEDASNG